MSESMHTSQNNLKTGTIGWFLFPDSYWSPGKIVDYDTFRVELLGSQDASHDLIPKPPGCETADTLVVFYPKSALSGWWTTAESLISSHAFQELEDVAIESVTDTLDSATSEMIRMAYREASDERGTLELTRVADAEKKSPKKRAKRESTKPLDAKSPKFERKPPRPEGKEAIKEDSRKPKEMPPKVTENKRDIAVIKNQKPDKPESVPSRHVLVSDAEDDDGAIVSVDSPHETRKPSVNRASDEASESESDDSNTESDESDLFLSKEERDKLFTEDYRRTPRQRRLHGQEKRPSVVVPRISSTKPKKTFFTNETDWFVAHQKDTDVQNVLRKLQSVYREAIHRELDPQVNFVQLSELDFLRRARDDLLRIGGSTGERLREFEIVEQKYRMIAERQMLGSLSSNTLRQRARKMQWVLPPTESPETPQTDNRVQAARSFRCRDIYHDDPVGEVDEAPELFASYRKYVRSVNETSK
ncbi:tyrosine recombinase [Perkinsela sp. CCAP 1560/4]|nr:tyrosine recombinase [Perkinsela sp. CCAP 1560/4]|eukprot:KNH03762.1 tyrosine recombinase [Perkinsela sp. CCAP 1560/4]